MGVSKVKDERKEKKKEEKKEKPKTVKVERTRAIVRLANTNLDGEKYVIRALRDIKGISFTLAKAICAASGIEAKRKLSSLNEEEREKLEKVIQNPLEFGVPPYLLNRRKDLKTGKDLHLTGSDLEVAQKFDIKRQIELRTYRGWRHMLGQPVRGQRTRSHFRERGRVVGVMKKAVRLQMAKKEKK